MNTNMKTNIVLLLIIGAICGVGMGIGIGRMKSQDQIDYTLEKNSDIMEEVIATNSRIHAIQDILWRIGHYTNINHSERSRLCPECAKTVDVTVSGEIENAYTVPYDTRPDTLETIKKNSDEIHNMVSNSKGMIGGLKITADIILDNLRKSNVETE